VFDDLDDFESFSRRPLKFIPAKVKYIHQPTLLYQLTTTLSLQVDDIKPELSAKRAKQLFYEMKREIDRKRLAADLEIKAIPPLSLFYTPLTVI